MVLADVPTSFLRVLALCFGLIWGSFLNVVIYRLPRDLSVVHPPSHCPACGAGINPTDNIPVLGWLILRGKARCCGAAVSPRYPLVEAIGGVLSLAILELLVLPLGPLTTVSRAAATYVADLALSLGMVAAAFIDLDHMFLPDAITIGGAVLGVATVSLREMTLTDGILGAVTGFTTIWLPFVVLYRRLRGRAGMGLGDAKLLMLAGAWFGWKGALFVLGAGAIQGTLVALPLFAVKGTIPEPEAVAHDRADIQAELATMTPDQRAAAEQQLADDPLRGEAGPGFNQARIAFGPFLAVATIECMFFGRDVLNRYLDWLTAV
jgi:leader peptidase (prepilin peptidase)/N-methyltransferase